MIREWENLENLSACRKKKARKRYICCITGKIIHKGDTYKELVVYQPKINKHNVFKIHSSVKSSLYNELRWYPNHLEDYKLKKELGFFQS